MLDKNIWKNPIVIIIVIYVAIRIASAIMGGSGETHKVDKTAYHTEYLEKIQESSDVYQESIEISIEVAENNKLRTKESIQEHLNEITLLKKGVIAQYPEYIDLQIIAVSELRDAEKLASYALTHYGTSATESWVAMNKEALVNMDRLGNEKLRVMEEMLSEMKDTLNDLQKEVEVAKS